MKTLLLIASLGCLPVISSAAVSVVIGEEGGGVYMRATGTYDVSEATKSGFGLKLAQPAMVGAPFGVFGWTTGEIVNSDRYESVVSGTLDGFDFAINASGSATSVPFFVSSELFYGPGYALFTLPKDSPVTGTIDNSVYFAGTSLEALGMVAGQSMTWSWTGDSLTVSVIPEPCIGLMAAAGGLGFFRRRRMK